MVRIRVTEPEKELDWKVQAGVRLRSIVAPNAEAPKPFRCSGSPLAPNLILLHAAVLRSGKVEQPVGGASKQVSLFAIRLHGAVL